MMMSFSSQPYGSLPDVAFSSVEAKYSNDDEAAIILDNKMENNKLREIKSFLLVDENEILQVSSEEAFIQKLGCNGQTPVKVTSIFGNTGEGKSFTLNNTFFNGREIFKTSAAQSSCTIGMWAAYDSVLNVVVIDTEGLLGLTSNQNQRTRLLLKVLAISDIVIYRTRSERLCNDLFTFLGDASQAYVQHFSRELRAASARCNFAGPLSSLGPAVIIFHETTHTNILTTENNKSAEDLLKLRFQKLGLSIDAFSALEYAGTRTIRPPTSFDALKIAIKKHLQNSSVRSCRPPGIIYQALKVLNEKFSGDIDKTIPSTFPDQYFTCNAYCQSCGIRCSNSMNHRRDGIPHLASTKCRYQHQFDNRIYLCKSCYERGEEMVVNPKTCASSDMPWLGLAKYAWSGYVLECSNCGVIYRSRQYWYGNKDPWETVVRTEIHHIWPGDSLHPLGNQNAAQRVLDGVQYISETMSSISARPTKMLSSWMADKVAPSYWIPNSQITHCGQCKKLFEALDEKHHCRACGGGFCDDCSSNSKPVPDKGWGPSPVRVCDKCFKEDSSSEIKSSDNVEVTARKVSEVLQTTLGTVVSAIEYPIGFIKDSARPAYWIPDHEITQCAVCQTEFNSKLPIHHCRACGQGVCDQCSAARRLVPSRGWDHPVRICSSCDKKSDL
ncbi:zinc finger FYVE domain-containing protein 1-like isoform X1 [Centruroides vittatus]|uniref:zinc finger FYVE domain-containing protein 1-like isoform X1 n=1 Tax=Centruroides vittatus TaxID=120091 RepID=UPI00350ED26F